MTVTIYTGPACGGCIATKHQFAKAGIKYTELPAADHVDELRAMGHTSKPVVVADLGDETVHWSGMRADNIKALAWLLTEDVAA